MFKFFYELFPGLGRVRRNVVNALFRLLDPFRVEDLGRSDEIRLLFEFLVLNESIWLDFGAVENELSCKFYKIKTQFADLFGVLCGPVHKVKFNSLLWAFQILFDCNLIDNRQHENLDESDCSVLAGVKEIPCGHEGVEFHNGQFGLVVKNLDQAVDWLVDNVSRVSEERYVFFLRKWAIKGSSFSLTFLETSAS